MHMRIERVLFAGLLVGALFFAVVPIALQLPVPLIVIESNSMSPQLVRGDVAFVVPAALSSPRIGDVAVFRESEDEHARWVAHRIVDGNRQEGFVTKGDNNNAIDQASPDSSRVMPAYIAGLVVTISDRPLRIPLIGLLVLRAQEYVSATILSWIALTIGIMFVAADVFGRARRSLVTRGNRIAGWLLWLPVFGILVLSLSETMIANSTEGTITYDPALAAGSRLTSQQQLDYSVSNDGILPLLLVLYSDDDRVLFSERQAWLSPGESQTVVISIADSDVEQPADRYAEALFRAGAYLPLLPPRVLHELIAWDIKGSAVVTAVVPVFLLAIAFIWIAPTPGNRRHRIQLRQRAAQ